MRARRGWILLRRVPSSHGVRLAVVSLCGALVVAACSSPSTDSDGAGARSSPTLAPTSPLQAGPSPTPTSTEERIATAYLAFWDAVEAASNPADPDHPRLAETAADPQLGQLREVLAGYREDGYIRRGDDTHYVKLLEIVDNGLAAIVDDCVELDPDGGLFDAESGERISGGADPGERQLAEARLELIGGIWKVVNVNVVEESSSCDPDVG